MPAKPNTNATVLFQKGKDGDNSLWDDSELIVAWSKQLDRIRALSADGERREPIPIAGDRGVDADPETPKSRGDGNDGPIEFAPSGDDSDNDVEEGAFYFNDNSGGDAKKTVSSSFSLPAKNNIINNNNNNNNNNNKGVRKQGCVEVSSSSSEGDEENECDDVSGASSSGSDDLMFSMRPSIPKGVDSALAGMLKAWYEAGFRTGQYAAQLAAKKKKKATKSSRFSEKKSSKASLAHKDKKHYSN